MTKPNPIRVLHVTPAFYPAVAYGGPIFSTKMITDGIAAHPRFEVDVLSTDIADPGNKTRLDLLQNPASFPAGYQVRYCRSLARPSVSPGMLARLPGAIRRADIVHLTGPYDFYVLPTLLLCRLFGTPVVWSPRGGFQATAQWANSPKRRLKTAFERIAGWLMPRGRTTLHVTADVEAKTSQRNLGPGDIALIPNAVDIPDTVPERTWRPSGKLRIAFLSRVHPKKGLDLLIAAMQRLPEHVSLDIYGSGDEEYLSGLKRKIAEQELTGRVVFHGLVSGADKTKALTDCDVFCLPTYSENFGIVVAEALGHATPVVTTVNAPWEGLEAQGCGHWISADTEAIVATLRDLETADLEAMGRRGRHWMETEFSATALTRQFVTLYERIAASGDHDGPGMTV